MEDTTESNVVEKLIRDCGLKKDRELAKILGISTSAVSKQRRQNKIPFTWLAKIPKNFNISLDALYAHDSIKLKSAIENPSLPIGFSLSRKDELIEIPLIEAKLSAGHGSFQVEDKIKRYFAFSSSFLHRKGNPSRMVMMQIDGDSMEPEIRDGDIVLIDQSQTDIRLGRIFAVGFEDAIYLKRIDKLPGKVLLKSVNPNYPPVEIILQDQTVEQFRVIGQVLWVGREYPI